MKKSNLTGLIAAGVAFAAQTNATHAQTATATFTNTTAQSGANITIPITPGIADADELLSISEGTASGGEFATFTLVGDYANSTQVQLDQISGGNTFLNVALDSITDKGFSTGTIDGLTFEITSSTSPDNITVPAGTVFTFAVPEPSIMALGGLGGVAGWVMARRRDQR